MQTLMSEYNGLRCPLNFRGRVVADHPTADNAQALGCYRAVYTGGCQCNTHLLVGPRKFWAACIPGETTAERRQSASREAEATMARDQSINKAAPALGASKR